MKIRQLFIPPASNYHVVSRLTLFWSVFIAIFFVFWKMLSDFAPLEKIGGMDVRVVNLVSSVAAAGGVAFTIYVVAKAMQKDEDEQKKKDYSEKPRPKPPSIDQVFKWKE